MNLSSYLIFEGLLYLTIEPKSEKQMWKTQKLLQILPTVKNLYNITSVCTLVFTFFQNI